MEACIHGPPTSGGLAPYRNDFWHRPPRGSHGIRLQQHEREPSPTRALSRSHQFDLYHDGSHLVASSFLHSLRRVCGGLRRDRGDRRFNLRGAKAQSKARTASGDSRNR